MLQAKSSPRLLRCFILLMTLLVISKCFNCSESLYEDYLAHWQRNFTAEKLNSEFTEKYNAFCKNREFVEGINLQNLEYDLDPYWQWMDKTDSERSEIVRVQLSVETITKSAVSVEQTSDQLRKVSATPPTYVDYRETGDVSSIKNQGTCGCCWSFTSVGAYESWMMMKGEQEYDLSEEYILECTNPFTQNVKKANYNSTCQGGYVDFAGELIRVNGVPTEAKYPYIAQTYTGSWYPSTSDICSANETIMYARDPSVTSFGVSRNNTNDKMKELIAKGPVAALIYADTGFQAYKSGTYSGCPSSFSSSYSRINHAVVIVGYDINGNYIVKNSWGTTWGVSGFGVVSKDNDCGLSAFAFQYSSSASPGNGVLFYNQTDLGSVSSERHLCSLLFIAVIVFMALMN